MEAINLIGKYVIDDNTFRVTHLKDALLGSNHASSLDNEYIPFFNLFQGHYKKVGEVRYLEYFLPKIHPSYFNAYNRIAMFKEAITNRINYVHYLKSDCRYAVAKQFIASVNNYNLTPIYLLAVKKEYVYEIDFRLLDFSQFAMFVSTDFMADPVRRLMYNMVRKEIIDPLLNVGIDLICTTDIKKWCYKAPSIIPNFNTISEMQAYFNQTTQEVIGEVFR